MTSTTQRKLLEIVGFRQILSAVVLVLISHNAQAEVYGWRDSTGVRHYSDRSHPAAKVLDIKPGYGFYQVKKVFDGDTILLEDGRKVRLLGINTPEITHRRQPEEAGGEEARRWLAAKIEKSKVRLETDAENSDKYGRLLSHLFTEDKEHLNLALVRRGLASVNIHPPNLLYADALTKAEQSAQKELLGIWQRPEYAPLRAESIPTSGHQGWIRIQGRVRDLHFSRKYVYLQLTESFAARIENAEAAAFTELADLVGKNVEIRGWINKYRDGFSMRLRHPSALVVLE